MFDDCPFGILLFFCSGIRQWDHCVNWGLLKPGSRTTHTRNSQGSKASHMVRMQIPGPLPRLTELDSVQWAQDFAFLTHSPLGTFQTQWCSGKADLGILSHFPLPSNNRVDDNGNFLINILSHCAYLWTSDLNLLSLCNGDLGEEKQALIILM